MLWIPKNIRSSLRDFVIHSKLVEKCIVNLFHLFYYWKDSRTWANTYWLGIPVMKVPFDLWIYQEIIHELRPDLIVESGTWNGASALYMAHICDLVGNGRVITIDNSPGASPRPAHPRIEYLLGSSTDAAVFAKVSQSAGSGEKVMVILDADHHMPHVLEEMRLYGTLVTKGCYLIVEDTNHNGHPVQPTFGPGPMEAVVQFLEENRSFEIDESREKFFMTFNPNGYLKKVV